MSDPKPDDKVHDAVRSLRWPASLVLIGLIALAALVLVLRFAKHGAGEVAGRVSETVRVTGEQAARIAEKFKQGAITETFVAEIPTLSRASGGNLELATATAVETFTREDVRTVAWDWISLGTTVSEIKVPVTYRYHLRLHDPWRLDVSNHTCIVHAPRIRPSQPPAIHTDRMEKRSAQGWARFDGRTQMEALERSITPSLRAYAADKRHVAMVREECRKTVAEFVRDWLLKEDHWRQDRFSTIKVLFEDEQALAPEGVEPTLQLIRE